MAETTPPDLMAVLDHAMETGDTSGTLGDAVADPIADGDTETPEGETPESETPEGETPEGETPEGEGEGERNADGTFKAKAKAEEKPEGEKPAGEKKPEAEPKKVDPINDPIPKDLKQETQERIRSLIATTKEATEKGEKVAKDFDYMIEGIKATGTTPEQYGEVLSFMALFNSNNPEHQVKALEILDNMGDRLAMLLGKDRQLSDPLTNHADLREAVAKGQITAQYAKEIARTRNGQTFRTELTTAQLQRQQQEQAAATEKEAGRNSLNELEASLKATDPQYDAKKAQLVPILKPIFATIPPSQWKARFEQAYRSLNIPAPVRRGPQPLRGGRSAGAGSGKGGEMKTEPGSMLDAVNAALEGMGK